MSTRWAVLLLAPGAVLAQTPAREQAIQRIEQAYAQTSLLAPDSPFTEHLLGAARAANPGVGEDTWSALKPEVAAAASAVMTARGGMVDTVLRASVKTLSDAEVQRLLAIYEDPVFRKMQSAMASVGVQRELAQAMWADAVRINGAINEVLVRHELKEAH